MTKIAKSIKSVLYVLIACTFVKLFIDIMRQDMVARDAVSIVTRIVSMIVCVLVLVLVYRMICNTRWFWEKYAMGFLIFFSVVLFALQLYFGNMLRVNPMYDFSSIYHGALDWLVSGTFERFYDYYYYYPNNLGAMTLLMRSFQLASKLGFQDFYFVGILLNSVLNVAMVVLTYIVCKKMFSVTEAVFVLFLYMIYPPMYLLGAVFYTDQLTMIFPVLIIAAYLYMKEAKTVGKTAIWCAVIAGASIFGYLLKATCLIATIAVVICLLLNGKRKKTFALIALLILVYVPVNLVFQNSIYPQHLDKAKAEQMNTPLETWVLMGLNENPGFSPADTEFSRSIENPQQRKEAVRRKIAERIENYGVWGLLDHLRLKEVTAFGDGTFELSYTFLFGFQDEENPLADYVTLLGTHYNSYWEFCTTLWYSYLLFAVLFMVFCAYSNIQEKKEIVGGLEVSLAVFGLFFFLLLWEIHPRYTVNYFSCFVLLTAGGMSAVMKRMGKDRC